MLGKSRGPGAMTKSVFTKEYRQFRQLLIEARKRKGLTQAQVAARLGKLQAFVSKYERGERRLDIVELLYVADALGVNPHYILASVISCRAGDEKPARESIWTRVTPYDLMRIIEQNAELREIILSYLAELELDQT